MTVILGVFLHFVGGFASGSFYIPYKEVKRWSWESYWIVGGLFSWLIVPPLAAWLTVPDFVDILRQSSSSALGWSYFMGLLWGIGGLTFGLSMRYLGLSLGMAVVLGYCSAFGTLIPPIYEDLFGTGDGVNVSFTSLLATTSGLWTLAGVAVCLLGIAICGRAGIYKERELTKEQQQASISEFNLPKGVLVATFSGVMSACMSFGYVAGKPIARLAVERGVNPLWQNNIVLVVILLGGLTTNLIWCLYLNARNRSFGDYTDTSTPLRRNYLFAALAGTTWYLQFFFYGMGSSQMGRYDFTSWTFHMAFIIMVSNVWGIYFGEWKGVSQRTFRVMLLGVGTVIFSTIIVGYGNYLASRG